MTKKFLIALIIVFCFVFKSSDKAPVYQEGFIGEVKLFAGNFAPRGWALCQGQLLPINNNSALFSIVGTMYGGDGRTTFALPDLRGRVPIGVGNGPGLSNYQVGQKGGQEMTTLNSLEVPSMSYQVPGYQTDVEGSGDDVKTGSRSVLTVGNQPNTSVNTRNSGGSQSHNNMQPYTGMNYIICLQGIYPSRS